MFPALKGSKIATGPVEGHLDIVLNGKPGTAMPAFGGQLNDVDIAAVITYERNAFGNNMGDMVQPIDVAKSQESQVIRGDNIMGDSIITAQPKGLTRWLFHHQPQGHRHACTCGSASPCSFSAASWR